MPIYDYACSACGHVTEVVHGINDAGPRFCPSCGAEGSMRKAFSKPAIVFKGSGWAKVDRRGSSATKSASSSGGESAKATDGSSADSTGSTGDSAKGTSSSGESKGESKRASSSSGSGSSSKPASGD